MPILEWMKCPYAAIEIGNINLWGMNKNGKTNDCYNEISCPMDIFSNKSDEHTKKYFRHMNVQSRWIDIDPLLKAKGDMNERFYA